MDDQNSHEGRDPDVDEKTSWHVVRLEVDTNHSPEFEVDEEKENVGDGSMSFRSHLEKSVHR